LNAACQRGREGGRGTYRPWRGSAAHIMFLASKACWISSGTDRARYCCEPGAFWRRREGGREEGREEGREGGREGEGRFYCFKDLLSQLRSMLL